MKCCTCFAEITEKKPVHCKECDKALHKECAINYDGVSFCDTCFVLQTADQNKIGDFELPEVIRRTYIETYRACPYKFYQEVIKGNVMPHTEYTTIGIDIHDIIESMLTSNVTYTEAKQTIEQQFLAYPDELFTNKPRAEMRIRADESLQTFAEVIQPTLDPVLTVEETIRFNIGDNIPDVQITMDLVTENAEGELEMHDWKTGRVMVGVKHSTDLQAPLYIYAVKERFKRPVKKFTFYYLQENKTRTFVRSEINPDVYICTVGKREYKINLTDAIREVKSIFSKVKKGQFPPMPDPRANYFTRTTCHLKEIGLCCQDIDPWNAI